MKRTGSQLNGNLPIQTPRSLGWLRRSRDSLPMLWLWFTPWSLAGSYSLCLSGAWSVLVIGFDKGGWTINKSLQSCLRLRSSQQYWVKIQGQSQKGSPEILHFCLEEISLENPCLRILTKIALFQKHSSSRTIFFKNCDLWRVMGDNFSCMAPSVAIGNVKNVSSTENATRSKLPFPTFCQVKTPITSKLST